MKFIAIGLTCALMCTIQSLKIQQHQNDAMDHKDEVWENTDNDCSFLD